MSLYIPQVFMNIGEDRITKVFDKLRLGKVNHVDFVLKSNGKSSAYVHFDYWYDNVASVNFQERIRNSNEKEVRVVYDDPWYWSVLENTSYKRVARPRKRKMYIDLSGLKTPPPYEPLTPDTPVKNNPISCNYDYESWEFNNSTSTNRNISSDLDLELVIKEDSTNDLITIDGRYVKTIEDENASLRKALLEAKTKYTDDNDYEHQVNEHRINMLIDEICEQKHQINMLNDDVECYKLQVSILEDKLLEAEQTAE